jgi:hypothetical protein
MPGGFGSNILFDGAALASVTTFIISLIKPFIEKIPGLRPDSSTHDAGIRIFNVLINALTAVALNHQAGAFHLGNWLSYPIVALGQAVGSQGLYSAIALTSGVTTSLKSAPPIAQPVRW